MDFPHNTVQIFCTIPCGRIKTGIPRGFVRKMAKATCVVKLLVKLSQFCYGFKDIRKYRKSSMDAFDIMADHWIEPQQ